MAQREKLSYAARGGFLIDYNLFPDREWEGDGFELREIVVDPWWEVRASSNEAFLWVPAIPNFAPAGMPTVSNVLAKHKSLNGYGALLDSIYLSFLSDPLLESLIPRDSEIRIDGRNLNSFERQKVGDLRAYWLSAVRDCRKFRRIAYPVELEISDKLYDFDDNCFKIPILGGLLQTASHGVGMRPSLLLELPTYTFGPSSDDAPAHLKIPAAVRDAELLTEERKITVVYFLELQDAVSPTKTWRDSKDHAAQAFSGSHLLLCKVLSVQVSGLSGNFRESSPDTGIVIADSSSPPADLWFRWSTISTIQELKEKIANEN